MRTIRYLIAVTLLMVAESLFAAAPEQNVAAAAAPAVAQKKILVVYYSRSGNTKKVAEAVAKALNADVEQIIDKKDRSGFFGFFGGGMDSAREYLTKIEPVKKDPANYDLVVLGTPVWTGKMTPAIRTYVVNNRRVFKSIAVFTTSGLTKPDKVVKHIEVITGQKAVGVAGFSVKQITDAGYDFDKRKFTPHLTLAREAQLKSEFDLTAYSARLRSIVTSVSKISLMKSERIHGRLTYTEIS
jgi:flavodoxin